LLFSQRLDGCEIFGDSWGKVHAGCDRLDHRLGIVDVPVVFLLGDWQQHRIMITQINHHRTVHKKFDEIAVVAR
jgi:hypothetical protein